MAMSREEILSLIEENMSLESQLLFSLLRIQSQPIAKEELWKLANVQKKLEGKEEDEKNINSRYTLDINIAKLEGAGLVKVKAYGRIRTYTLSRLGQEFVEFVRTRK